MKRFGYAQLTDEMLERLSEEVKGKTVYDLGCGDKSLSRQCLNSGAKKVLSIDKDTNGLFCDVLPTLKPKRNHVSILSWPHNYLDLECEKELINFLDKTDTLIVIACMTGGTICGTPNLWGYLRTLRSVTWSERHRCNSFIMYGIRKVGDSNRELLQEEDPRVFTEIIQFNL